MSTNKNFDLDNVIDELSSHLKDMIENNLIDQIDLDNIVDELSSRLEDSIMDELSSHLEDVIENTLIEQVNSTVASVLQDQITEALGESFSNFEFILKDGTIARPKHRMKVLSPDKTNLLVCYGGLRVNCSFLMIQTSINKWEILAHYKSEEEAIEALIKVKNAMESDIDTFEL